MGWLSKLFNLDSSFNDDQPTPNPSRSKHDGSRNNACNRLKLVLMHDRTQLSPETLENMRDELVKVISKYVEIDKEALELNLESESNTIALVANIPVLRARKESEMDNSKTKPSTSAKNKANEPTTPTNTSKNEKKEPAVR